MPFIERKSTVTKMRSELARAQRMRARGVEMEISEKLLDCEPLIIYTGDEHTALVFDPKEGKSAAYAIWVQLVAREPITVLDCQITTPWDDQIVLVSVTEESRFYKFGGREFPRHEVLNSRLENRLTLKRGQVIEGVILAWGLHSIPAHYPHGHPQPCTLLFIDQYEREISREIRVSADRTWKGKKAVPLPDGGLYGGSPQYRGEDMNVTMGGRYRESLLDEKVLAEEKKKMSRFFSNTEEVLNWLKNMCPAI